MLYILVPLFTLHYISMMGGRKMGALIKLEEMKYQEQRDLTAYFEYQQVEASRVFDLVSSLTRVPYLSQVGMQFNGGPISGAQLSVRAEMTDPEYLRAMSALVSLKQGQQEQRALARTVRAYEGLEVDLKRPGLFEGIGFRSIALGGLLENGPEVDYYNLGASVMIPRNQGTKYKGDLIVPVELHVRNFMLV